MLSLSVRTRACAPIKSSLTRHKTCSVVAEAVKMKVVVTGAAGKTGGLVLKKLMERRSEFEPLAVVRNDKSRASLLQKGLREESVVTVDIGSASSETMATAFAGASALVLATSAVPQLVPLSIFKVLWAKVTGAEGVRPDFTWKGDQNPEKVDWLGAKAQIDAAKLAGIKRVVFISSMGGCDSDNMLNKIGDGNILEWKRKAEQYLIQSGLEYCIIHPGGLNDEEGGKREVVIGVNDSFLKKKVRNIPRADVAEISVQALTLESAKNRAIDAICLPAGEGSPVSDWDKLMSGMPDNCDYSINSQWK